MKRLALLCLVIPLIAWAQYEAELTFEQIDFYWDKEEIVNSSWGSVTVEYAGTGEILYFNLAVDQRWVIQNMPVLGYEGDQSITYSFDLDVPDGKDVRELTYAFNMTESVLDSMPGDFRPATVGDRAVDIKSGLAGKKTFRDEGPRVIIGAAVVQSAKHTQAFPNQECGDKECVPAAVSNSLKFLNKKDKLKLTEEQTSIEEMKKATDWSKGCCIWGGCGLDWWKKKKKYMQDNKYPITTDSVGNFDKVITEIKRGQDVELCLDHHCVAVVGISKLKDGRYSIDIVHDTEQGKAGGTIKETIFYDPKTKKFSGGVKGWANGDEFHYFVVECPKKE